MQVDVLLEPEHIIRCAWLTHIFCSGEGNNVLSISLVMSNQKMQSELPVKSQEQL